MSFLSYSSAADNFYNQKRNDNTQQNVIGGSHVTVVVCHVKSHGPRYFLKKIQILVHFHGESLVLNVLFVYFNLSADPAAFKLRTFLSVINIITT